MINGAFTYAYMPVSLFQSRKICDTNVDTTDSSIETKLILSEIFDLFSNFVKEKTKQWKNWRQILIQVPW